MRVAPLLLVAGLAAAAAAGPARAVPAVARAPAAAAQQPAAAAQEPAAAPRLPAGLPRELAGVTVLVDRVGGRVDWSHATGLIAAGIVGRDGYADIELLRPDGTRLACLTCGHPQVPQQHNDLPAWHPSGEYILFQSQDPALDLPVGERLEAYLTQGGAGLNHNLWLITRDGRRAWQLTRVRAGEASLHPHLSPDGRTVFWAARVQEGRRKVWALRLADLVLDGREARLVNVRTLRPRGDPQTFYESHGFTPDGRTVIFSASIGRAHPFDLDVWTMDLRTGRLRNLTDTPGEWDEHAQISPDGRTIVWMTDRGYPVPVRDFSRYGAALRTDYWLMDADGGRQRRLTFFNERGAPEDAGGRTIVADSSWNRAGNALVATMIVFAGGQPERRIVRLDLALRGAGVAPHRPATPGGGTPEPTVQERQCMASGWNRVVLPVAGLQRTLFWRGPDGPWTRGAVIVLHGGGGEHTHFCVASPPIVAPQVRWAERALAQGFAVFALNSSDRVTDSQGRVCGKVWDDEVRERPNLDLPFIGEVIRAVIPQTRPAGSRTEVFLTGLSSGGYMTTRAATHFDGLVTAFAPVSSGDPYGWHRICEPGLTPRTVVHGAGFDNETGKQIIEPGACQAERYPNEKPWESMNPPVKPAFRVFHHEDDGINDRSCAEKVIRQLRAHGYREVPAFWLRGNGQRSLANHLWQDAYNVPLLEFFASQLR